MNKTMIQITAPLANITSVLYGAVLMLTENNLILHLEVHTWKNSVHSLSHYVLTVDGEVGQVSESTGHFWSSTAKQNPNC